MDFAGFRAIRDVASFLGRNNAKTSLPDECSNLRADICRIAWRSDLHKQHGPDCRDPPEQASGNKIGRIQAGRDSPVLSGRLSAKDMQKFRAMIDQALQKINAVQSGK